MRFLIPSGMQFISRRMMPVTSLCPLMTIRTEILLVLLLATFLAAELAPIDVRGVCSSLFRVRLRFAVTISRDLQRSDEVSSFLFPFLAALAPRAPPAS